MVIIYYHHIKYYLFNNNEHKNISKQISTFVSIISLTLSVSLSSFSHSSLSLLFPCTFSILCVSLSPIIHTRLCLLPLTCLSLFLVSVHYGWLRVSPVTAGVQSEVQTCQDRKYSYGPEERQFRAGRQQRLPAQAQSPAAYHLLATHLLHSRRAGGPSRTGPEPIGMRPRASRARSEKHEHRSRLLGENQQTGGRSSEPQIGSTHRV